VIAEEAVINEAGVKPAVVAMFPQTICIGVVGKGLPSCRVGEDVAITGD